MFAFFDGELPARVSSWPNFETADAAAAWLFYHNKHFRPARATYGTVATYIDGKSGQKIVLRDLDSLIAVPDPDLVEQLKLLSSTEGGAMLAANMLALAHYLGACDDLSLSKLAAQLASRTLADIARDEMPILARRCRTLLNILQGDKDDEHPASNR